MSIGYQRNDVLLDHGDNEQQQRWSHLPAGPTGEIGRACHIREISCLYVTGNVHQRSARPRTGISACQDRLYA
jgi:hypothetical protein